MHECTGQAGPRMGPARLKLGDHQRGEVVAVAAVAVIVLALGRFGGRGEHAAAAVQHSASAVLNSASCARFFNGPALGWAGNEVPVPAEGRSLRIDRLVALNEGGQTTWWVLDYKLRSDPGTVEPYRQQLQAYVDAVQALQPADRVQGAFITGRGDLVLL